MCMIDLSLRAVVGGVAGEQVALGAVKSCAGD